jgi:transcriptional regulator with XRE-family HTH domain
MNYGERLKKLRESKKLSQQQLADRLKINRSTYARYELGQTQPDFETLEKLADFFEVSTDYLLGRTDIKSTKVTVAGKEVELSPEEYKLFEELKKHPILFHDLASDPEGKVKELLKLYKMKKILLEEDNEEYGEGFGEIED